MVLGTEVFNEEVKSAITEAYFFLADILISKEREMKQEKHKYQAVVAWLFRHESF